MERSSVRVLSQLFFWGGVPRCCTLGQFPFYKHKYDSTALCRLHDCGCSVPLNRNRRSLGHYDDANYGHTAASNPKPYQGLFQHRTRKLLRNLPHFYGRNPGLTTQKVPSWVGLVLTSLTWHFVIISGSAGKTDSHETQEHFSPW